MAAAPDGLTLRTLDHVDARLAPAPLIFTPEERAAIDAHYAARKAANPALWNGRVLLLDAHRFEERRLVADYAEADYAALLWLLSGERAHPRLRVSFAMGALRGADGGFVLIRMAQWTANAGRIYFAAGTPDLTDLTPEGTVDLEGSVRRELTEETGLTAEDITLAPGWTALHDARRLALLREVRAQEEAEALAARIRRFGAREQRPEFDEVLVVRGPQDFAEGMSPLIRRYLAQAWKEKPTPAMSTGQGTG
ncbi:NUDIX hydrolase [Ancylobacter polymorphus]|uniref:NUDIX hydrolase n=1 Tax=Ancylobacter polymorphus TaxID=223390 RepID=A0A9E6ZZX8_9HYPH|nr:NUDIX hydrolase [Ancylobacter polymorphus]UOK69733.1 NUDIX hydrolase [Ancylobacter polymorphus]